MDALIGSPDTSSWYQTNYGCIRTDPTLISRRHTFPDAVIPRGLPDTAAPATKVCAGSTCGSDVIGCVRYETAWPARAVDPESMIETERNHPQFAFRAGGPASVYQIEVESQLRRLDQPLSNCQAVLPEDAPLYRNTVAPPVTRTMNPGVQNAANPIAVITRADDPAAVCRVAADAVVSAISDRWVNNPTRQDTMRIKAPVSPPGIGTFSNVIGF